MTDIIASIRDALLNRGLASTVMTGIQLAVLALWIVILGSAIASGEWRGYWIFLPAIVAIYGLPMLVYRLVTKKTVKLNVRSWGPYGMEWNTAEIHLEKTEEEKAEDASFLDNLFPVIPVMMFIVLAIFMTMSGEGNNAGPIATALIFSIIASIAVYFGFKWVRRSNPTSALLQAAQGAIVGVVFAPHTFFMIGAVVGLVTGLLALVF